MSKIAGHMSRWNVNGQSVYKMFIVTIGLLSKQFKVLVFCIHSVAICLRAAHSRVSSEATRSILKPPCVQSESKQVFNGHYFMIDTFSFVIQQPLFNLQPYWILTNWKSGEGLIIGTLNETTTATLTTTSTKKCIYISLTFSQLFSFF